MIRRLRYWWPLAAAFLSAGLAAGCDPCAGTPNCHLFSMVSYGGQFIEHKTGRTVAGVVVEFTRESGRELEEEPIRAVSDADGFFLLRTGTYGDGSVTGRLTVTPPLPWKPYVVPNFRLDSRIVRGDGVYAGRLVVDPYIFLIGGIYSWLADASVVHAVVTLVRTGGVRLANLSDTLVFSTDNFGNFLIQDYAETHGVIEFDATVVLPDNPDVFRFPYRVATEFRQIDPFVRRITVPRRLQHVVEVTRRGTGEFVPGVSALFYRTGGVRVSQDTISIPLVNGRMPVMPVPLEDGELRGNLVISPPAPFPAETIPLRLPTSYTDEVFLAGVFGWGPQVYMQAQFVDRATGFGVGDGVEARFRRVGGVARLLPPGGDTVGLRITDSLGRAPYIAGAPETGPMVFDIEVSLRGQRQDTIRSVSVPARSDDLPTLVGPFRVGAWFPWYVEVRDAQSDAPVAGARVSFRPSSGVDPSFLARISGADGRVTIAGIPRNQADVSGSIRIEFPSGSHRDTVIASTLRPLHSDVLQLLRLVKVERTTP